MRTVRVLERRQVLLSFGLLGILGFSGGCDSGGGGESNVAPATPPPGQSGEDQAKARAGSMPAGKQAAKKN